MTAVDVDALEAARAAATAGWNVLGGTHAQLVIDGLGENVCETASETDAELICQMHAALPALLAAARERDALRAGVKALAERYDRPATPDGLRALHGGGWVAHELLALLAAVDGGGQR